MIQDPPQDPVKLLTRDAGDRVVVRHGTEVVLVREREKNGEKKARMEKVDEHRRRAVVRGRERQAERFAEILRGWRRNRIWE